MAEKKAKRGRKPMDPQKKLWQRTLCLKREEWEAVRLAAEAAGKSVNGYIRELVVKHLKRHQEA
jgi:predicted HicB family RNase H-like nuclease